MSMHKDIEKVLFSEQQIEEIVDKLGKEISEDYKDKNLLLVGILKGSVVFMADLMRKLTVPCNIEFMALSLIGLYIKLQELLQYLSISEGNAPAWSL